ncbi:L-ascorbate metabolism protein UlaG, beta-lactamase superfamily [Methylacidimicrobium sp. AP8]|uniref:MBL fold metallo-hydrolase n=1 Tax=Methylacidimicrobium sp. AP8 TaxID=2730359 RepID=UPI0018C11CFF|nr:MBL fold metallo-hydrolase [Methylacidimicrobium sp. AP8]CAB4244210.1 L-ascorbate metabolism protein UlaG, beta-lactamase superfamily [Methylacidimicrobium sp. AP8]
MHRSQRPKKGRRNFLLDVLLPSLFARREGVRHSPSFPSLSEGQVCLTWVGHASFLVQTPRHNILIDPNWANWMLVIRRLKRAGIAIEDLPAIDLVLITHAHFDHLNRRSLREVATRQPAVVPSKVGSLVRGLGFDQVREMAWWDRWDFDGLSIVFTPARHWGARYLADSDRGYGGYALSYGGRTIYHCGDTAYFDGFPEIGRRIRPEIVLMPIGCYDQPSKRVSHITPEKAIQAFLELQGKILIPMHFGTYRMSYEPPHEPAYRLLVAASQAGILSQVHFLHEGLPRVF